MKKVPRFPCSLESGLCTFKLLLVFIISTRFVLEAFGHQIEDEIHEDPTQRDDGIPINKNNGKNMRKFGRGADSDEGSEASPPDAPPASPPEDKSKSGSEGDGGGGTETKRVKSFGGYRRIAKKRVQRTSVEKTDEDDKKNGKDKKNSTRSDRERNREPEIPFAPEEKKRTVIDQHCGLGFDWDENKKFCIKQEE